MSALETYRSLSARYVALLMRGDTRHDSAEALDLAGQLETAWQGVGSDDRSALTREFSALTCAKPEMLDPDYPGTPGEWCERIVSATEAEEAAMVSEGCPNDA